MLQSHSCCGVIKRLAEKGKSPTSMGTNKGTSSDSEEISDAKFTIVSQFLSKAKRQPRREAWFGPGSSWNPFRKPTKPNESYAKEQFRAAESTINKSTPTTSGTGHSNTAKTVTRTRTESSISKISNYSNSN